MRSFPNHRELGVGHGSDVAPAAGPALRLLPGGGSDAGNPEASELAARARRASAALEGTRPLVAIWQALVTGREHAAYSFNDDERCFVVVRDARPEERLPSLANARNLALLTRVLLGEPQKVVALDLRISASSVAAIAAQYAHAMGFENGVSRVPILLIMAAQAATRGHAEPFAQTASFVHDGVAHRLLGVARPNPARWDGLSAAECAVVSLLLERYRNADIARVRRTSSRTVANQVGSVMHKIGARGRCEIISRLISLPLP
jgi:DNA-binding CsgD family transcriptional regulator